MGGLMVVSVLVSVLALLVAMIALVVATEQARTGAARWQELADEVGRQRLEGP